MIDLVGSSGEEEDMPAASASHDGGESEEEVNNKEEEEKEKVEDRLMALGIESFRIYRSCFTDDDMGLIRDKYGIPTEYVIQVPAAIDCPYFPPSAILCFFLAQLEAGLHFSLAEFLC
ncbi:UNVERIFIED_CONTAM: hypothetical protein Slati_4208300 [Sesamum latifolium]|uniref:Uncharacterized protein n=1 Tax=Sesamum latifolium TaxID=2727402 RepID=A0AAW2TAM2_9LAMI